MKVAVVCVFLNEYFFIPYWQNYYGNLFGYNNLYAIGDLKNDSSMRLLEREVNLIDYSPEIQANFVEHCDLAIKFQTELLRQGYDVVIYAEADQFFIPDPEKYKDLNDYLEKNTQDYIKVSGWNVQHIIDEEQKFNPSQPVLSQRKYWFKDPGPEDKMTIVRKPVEWYGAGFHDSTPDVPRDPDLYNIHLHLCDFPHCHSRRHTKTNPVKWAPNTGPGIAGGHTWTQGETLFNTWMDYALRCGISEIPDKFKGLI
jgi:hypothetical protein